MNLFWSYSKSIGSTILALGNTFNAFKASKLVIDASIGANDPLYFPNHTEMLDYIANQVLPTSIFHSSQSCKFKAYFLTDSEFAPNFIASLLQLPAIAHRANILIELCLRRFAPQQQQYIFRRLTMPTDGIAKWLHHSEGTGRERVLCIHLGTSDIENLQEIFNHLKEVNFYANFYFSFQFSSLLKFK